ncbi:hypothetical protein AK95_14505 [Paenibacillus sp. LC231]|uniref:hypothetical protein n=1 Tax=Paenibacillus sp. LC231 TaxID=1120679 RepID=UPI0008DD9786|nr:hypothetical protein [Paenibacillus sp. LC231]OIB04825.1 hypothetical protein AK95_14505 [Paenibacillus sp. LC231]
MATKRNSKEEEQIRVDPETFTGDAPVLIQGDAQAEEVTAAAAPEQLIYIGPPIRKNGVGLRTNQVFIGGHPAYLEALYTEYPHIKSLFVPVNKLQESLKQIKQTGTALNAALLSLKGV